jgi:hypothetical protein
VEVGWDVQVRTAADDGGMIEVWGNRIGCNQVSNVRLDGCAKQILPHAPATMDDFGDVVPPPSTGGRKVGGGSDRKAGGPGRMATRGRRRS